MPSAPRDVQIFCPLITHSEPSRSARSRSAGQVGSRLGFGVTLHPNVVTGQDARDEATLLFLRSPTEQRVAEHLDTRGVGDATQRYPGAGELLGEDHLLNLRTAASAVFLRPRDAEEPVFEEDAAPAQGKCLGVLPIERADAAPVAREVFGEKGAQGHPELFGLRRVAQVHVLTLSSSSQRRAAAGVGTLRPQRAVA